VARRLQVAALALLWLQLLLLGQLQTWVALAMPLLIVLNTRPTLPTQGMLLGLTAAALLLWGLDASMADRTALLRSGCNLLWLLSGLKLLETRNRGGERLASLLLLLAIGLAGLGTQALGANLVLAAATLLALASLLCLHSASLPLVNALQHSAGLVALALPLLVATFVLLPRMEPLWSLSLGSQARTGLSSRLAPGALASLVQDDGLAARLSLAPSQLPPPEQRYWRVLVHQRFDGASWTPAAQDPLLPSHSRAPTPAAAEERWPLERWMVEASDLRQRPWSGGAMPQTARLEITTTGTLIGRSPLQERSLYTLERPPGPPAWQLTPPTSADLDLPPAANPKLQALGHSWQQQAPSTAERVLLARRWYLQQGFRYTLEPGALGSINPLDGFLFDTRAGFCEHFAASFSALMRAAGVPARVVVGYQGGSWQQPIGSPGYLELRHRDAHAWSEVWLDGRGWVRVDPTAWVVPERLRRSLAASLSTADRARLSPPAPLWLQSLAVQWQGLDYRWQLWVMGFDRQRQRSLLGKGPGQGLLALLAMAAALILGLLPLLLERREGDRMQRRLQRLLRQLEQRGFPLEPGESLQRFTQRAGRHRPELEAPLAEVCRLYERWRFGPQPPSPELQTALLNALGRCRVRATSLKQPKAL